MGIAFEVKITFGDLHGVVMITNEAMQEVRNTGRPGALFHEIESLLRCIERRRAGLPELGARMRVKDSDQEGVVCLIDDENETLALSTDPPCVRRPWSSVEYT